MKKITVRLDRERLTALRKRDCLSQQELSEKSGVSKGAIENAEKETPVSLMTVSDLAEALEVRPVDLFHPDEREQLTFTTPLDEDRVGCIPPLPELFIGRDGDLKAIRVGLMQQRIVSQRDGHQARFIIGGCPGIGKTTLSKAIAHDRAIKSTFANGLLWTSLGQKPEIRQTLVNWMNAIGLTFSPDVTNRELSERIGGYLADREILLILDDVWDHFDASLLLLGGSGCAILVTTRLPTVTDHLSTRNGDTYNLDVLSEDESAAIFERLAPAVFKQHERECRELARDVEFLPLALQVAGRLLAIEQRRNGDVSSLFEQLRERSKELLLNSRVPTDVHALLGEKAPTVQALLALTTDLLDETTRERFAYLGGFVEKPAVMTTDLLAKQWKVKDAAPTIRSLLDYGLIEQISSDRYQIHAVLKAHAISLWKD